MAPFMTLRAVLGMDTYKLWDQPEEQHLYTILLYVYPMNINGTYTALIVWDNSTQLSDVRGAGG